MRHRAPIRSKQLLLQSIRDPRLAEIVGGHLQADAITDREPDEMLAHFAGKMGQNLVLIVQPDTKHGSRQNRRDGTFYLNGLFVSQNSSTLVSLFSRAHKLSCFRQKTSRILPYVSAGAHLNF